MSAFEPFEIMEPSDPADVPHGLVLVCDHASNTIPPDLGDLGLPEEDMQRHIAYDVGARGVTHGLSRRMGVPAILSRFSRLVIDPNRGEDDPTLVMQLYDGSVVPANRGIADDEIERRLDTYHRPYHDAVAGLIRRVEAAQDRQAVLVSIHSFTPRFRMGWQRPWHVGLLWDRDERLVAPLRRRLNAQNDLCVGDNQPYSGELEGDCMWRHGTRHGRPHVLIEIRNDLIRDADGQEAWAARLAPLIRDAAAELREAD